MNKVLRKIVLISLFISLYFIINAMVSNASVLLWPIGSNDNNINTYYIDSNGNRLEAVEINAENDKKYIKVAIGFDSETTIEYNYGPRNYRVNNNLDPNEQNYSADNENHYAIDIRSGGVKSDGSYVQSRTNHHNIIAGANGIVLATSADRTTNAGVSFSEQTKRKESNDGGGYGNYVIIKYADNVVCMYAHLYKNSILVEKGDTVIPGQVIGKMGSSGDSGHPHLHFEVRKSVNAMIAYPNNETSNLTVSSYDNTSNPTDYVDISNQRPDVGVVIAKECTIDSIDNTSIIVKLSFSGPIYAVNATCPTIKLKIGENIRTLKLSTIDEKAIYYTYTIQDEDEGKVSLDSISGGDIRSKQQWNYKVKTSRITELSGEEITIQKRINKFKVTPGSICDVDKDGLVCINDAIHILKYYAESLLGHIYAGGANGFSTTAADVNNDKSIDANDAVLVLKVIAGMPNIVELDTIK